MSELTDRSINASNVDLTNCDREPIHVPGAIQPHGMLLAFDEGDDMILQVSENCGKFLGMEVDAILGNRLGKVFGIRQAELIKQTFANSDLKATNPLKLHIGPPGGDKLVNGILHRDKGTAFLELEPASDESDAPLRAYQTVQQTLTRIQRAASLAELWAVVAEEVKMVLGYDRVMIYKFDRANNGEVIEERVSPGFEPFVGLHYPASDIPRQARLLYTVNYTRHMPSTSYMPAALIPLIFPVTQDLTDLSHSTLRSVSPIHLEYLRNMGVQASVSISLIVDSALWGLIACHNYSPKFVPYEMRSACELLGQVISVRMASLENDQKTRYKMHTNMLQSRFLGALATEKDLRKALMDSTPGIFDYMPAGGAAICRGNDCLTAGKTPSSDNLTQLVRKLRRLSSPVFVSDALSTVYAEAAEYKDVASGLMALTLNREQNTYILWFRPEQVQTVNWAGDPRKPVSADPNMRLHPRKSFELWKETVEGKSVPWTEAEIESALELRSTISNILKS
jgi:two-component system, chemotaxis family, sensor kinase Cph1